MAALHTNALGFVFDFGLTKTEEEKIKETLAETFADPTDPLSQITTPASKRSRVEELAYTMELVETNNQNPTILGVRYNNPGCLKFSPWQRPYGAVPGINGFSRFPVYSAGKQA